MLPAPSSQDSRPWPWRRREPAAPREFPERIPWVSDEVTKPPPKAPPLDQANHPQGYGQALRKFQALELLSPGPGPVGCGVPGP